MGKIIEMYSYLLNHRITKEEILRQYNIRYSEKGISLEGYIFILYSIYCSGKGAFHIELCILNNQQALRNTISYDYTAMRVMQEYGLDYDSNQDTATYIRYLYDNFNYIQIRNSNNLDVRMVNSFNERVKHVMGKLCIRTFIILNNKSGGYNPKHDLLCY